jgi:hypothetical protein
MKKVINNFLCEKMSKPSVMHVFGNPSLLANSYIFEISEMTSHA